MHGTGIDAENMGSVDVTLGRPIPADEVARHTTAELARSTRDAVVCLYEDACDERKC